MDLYDEIYEIKNGREVDDSPPPDLDVSSSLQFINQEEIEEEPKVEKVLLVWACVILGINFFFFFVGSN